MMPVRPIGPKPFTARPAPGWHQPATVTPRLPQLASRSAALNLPRTSSTILGFTQNNRFLTHVLADTPGAVVWGAVSGPVGLTLVAGGSFALVPAINWWCSRRIAQRLIPYLSLEDDLFQLHHDALQAYLLQLQNRNVLNKVQNSLACLSGHNSRAYTNFLTLIAPETAVTLAPANSTAVSKGNGEITDAEKLTGNQLLEHLQSPDGKKRIRGILMLANGGLTTAEILRYSSQQLFILWPMVESTSNLPGPPYQWPSDLNFLRELVDQELFKIQSAFPDIFAQSAQVGRLGLTEVTFRDYVNSARDVLKQLMRLFQKQDLIVSEKNYIRTNFPGLARKLAMLSLQSISNKPELILDAGQIDSLEHWLESPEAALTTWERSLIKLIIVEMRSLLPKEEAAGPGGQQAEPAAKRKVKKAK